MEMIRRPIRSANWRPWRRSLSITYVEWRCQGFSLECLIQLFTNFRGVKPIVSGTYFESTDEYFTQRE